MSDHETQAQKAAREAREAEEAQLARVQEIVDLEYQWMQPAVEPKRTLRARKLKGGTE